MADSDRVATLEAKVSSLEERVNKVEDSVERKNATLGEIDTRLQLLNQKFDTFIKAQEDKEEDKKFNWTQIVAILGIVIGFGATIWATTYEIKKVMGSDVQSKNEIILKLSAEDMATMTEMFEESE